MTIAFISEHASPLAILGGTDSGGQNVYVAEVAAELARKKHSVDIYTRWENPDLPQVIQWKSNVRVIHVKAGEKKSLPKESLLPLMTEFTAETARFWQQNQLEYDLIHAHFFMSALVAKELNQRFQIPFIVTYHALGEVRKLHQGKEDTFSEDRPKIEKSTMEAAAAIIAECPQDVSDIKDLYHYTSEKIKVIPCGVNPTDFFPVDKPLAAAVLGLDPAKTYVLQLGRMVKRKGVETVIRGFGIFLNRVKNPDQYRLLIVGGDTEEPDPHRTPEIGRLQTLVASLGLKQNVEFQGNKQRAILKYYYSVADVFLSLPWYEPFGITPLEAMACGTPVIGSRVGGIKYSVKDGVTGLLVEPKNQFQAAEALEKILTSSLAREQMRHQAIERVQSQFTWQEVTTQLLDVYEAVVRQDQLSSLDFDTEVEDFEQSFIEAKQLLSIVSNQSSAQLKEIVRVIKETLVRGGKVLACGNGGSAADAQHFAAEFVGRFEVVGRKAYPVQALTTDTSVLTAWANDATYKEVFSRQVEAFGKSGDVLVVMSTSGSSPNIIEALVAAYKKGMTTIALLGNDGGEAKELADLPIVVPSQSSARIQEVHIHLLHAICHFVERRLLKTDQTFIQIKKKLRPQQSLSTVPFDLDKKGLP